MLERIGERRASLSQQQQDIAAMLRELDVLEAQCRERLGARLGGSPKAAAEATGGC